MKEGVVAFVDILGFSNSVKEASKNSDPANLDSMLHIIENLANANHEGGAKKIAEGSYEISTTITSFSDSLVISQYLDADPNRSNNSHDLMMALINVAQTASYITGFCLSQGLLVRGGVSFGSIKHTKNIIFGVPYIEAVEIENNLAIKPRIVVHNNLLAPFENNMEQLMSFCSIRRDYDGLFFIDWIEGYLQTCSRIEAIQGMLPSKGDTNLKNLKPLIKQTEDKMSYYKNRSNSQKEFSKWYWMASYINNWLDDGLNEDLKRFKKEMMKTEGITKITL